MIKTVRCKLNPTPDQARALRETILKFADACNEILAESKRLGLRHRYAIQAALYKPVRLKHGLTACYGVRACDRVATVFTARHKARAFRPTSATIDKSLCRYIPKSATVSISTVHGRIKVPLSIGDYQRRLLAHWTPGIGTLSVDRKGRFWVNLRIVLADVPNGGAEPLGIDLGIKRIATLSNGVTFSGRTLNRKRERYARTKASLQSKGTKGCKRVLKRLAGREYRFQRDVNHVISKQIVALAKEGDCFISMENLKGITKRNTRGKNFRRMLGRWNFYTLKQFIAYKAAEAGVRLVTVDPRYTSKTCPYCGHLGHREKLKFTCFTCGLVGDADLVGAFNIAAKGAQANRPEIAGCIER